MKRLILAAFALTTAAGVFAQGTVFFANRISVTGTQPGLTTHIWGPSSTAPSLALLGFGSTDTTTRTPGTTPINFANFGMTMVGQPGGLSASTTLIQLLAVNAPSAALMPESSLVPDGQVATFRTQTSTAGGIVPLTDTLNTITSQGNFATFEMVAWDDSSGQYSTWVQASSAWMSGEIAAGKSGLFQVSAIGGGLNTPPNLNDIQDFNSFNLYYVPEPTSFALVGLGAAALLIFRRRQ